MKKSPVKSMKELITQRVNDYVFWKIDDEYCILFLHNKKRKKEFEYKLNAKERDRYYEEGMDFIKELILKLG